MRLLLDTHAFLWFALNDPKLSMPAENAIRWPGNIVFISPASYWEIAIKASAGKYKLNVPYEKFWRGAIDTNRFEVLPIDLRHTSQLVSLPFHHKDPFDRLLVATALADNLQLVSSDATLDAYGINRIW